MVEIDASIQMVIAVISTFAATGIGYIGFKMRQIARTFSKIDKLERNMKVLVLVLSEALPQFRKSWEKYAAVSDIELIDMSNR